MCVIPFQSVRALINDFKYGAFAYKAAHIFFTDSKYACTSNRCSTNLNNADPWISYSKYFVYNR